MINQDDLTTIASFGEEVSSSASIQAEIDPDKMADSDGNLPSEFLPGTEVFFLVHYDSSKVVIKNILSTDGGDIQRVASVTRTKEQRLTFESSEPVSLSYIPSGSITVKKWYGRTSGLTREGQQVTADSPPCLADISYPIAAIQYKHRIVSGYTLNDEDKFYTAAVIEYEEIT